MPDETRSHEQSRQPREEEPAPASKPDQPSGADQHGGMNKRGVTRPMAEGGEHGGGTQDYGGQSMSREDRLSMLEKHHAQTIWIP